MKNILRILPLIMLLAVAVGFVQAETTADAQQWLEKLVAIRDEGAFKLDYTMRMQMPAVGEANMQGSATYADGNKVRMSSEITMSGPQGNMSIKMKQVSDGSTMWMDMDSPMTGHQVMKIGVEQLSLLAQRGGGMGMMGDPSKMDPIGQLHQIAGMFDLSVKDVSGGRVTLDATMTEQTRASMAQSMPGLSPEMMEQFTLVLDESTGLPIRMTIGGDTPAIVMDFTNVERLASVSPETFTYIPPAGVTVMDLGQQLGGGRQ